MLVAALEAKLGAPEAARVLTTACCTTRIMQVRLAANAELGALLAPAEALPYLRQAAELASRTAPGAADGGATGAL